MLVGARDHEDLVARHPVVAAEDVRGHVRGRVADVPGTAGVRPGHRGQDVSIGHATQRSEAVPGLNAPPPPPRTTTRLGSPASRATSAIAAFRSVPACSRAATAATSAAGSASAGRRGAPPTTSVISPAHPAGGPVRQLGQRAPADLLVGLGHLPAGRRRAVRRRGPRPASASVAASRCGASKSTTVRRSSASASSARRRSPGRRGRKPSKQNRSDGSPDSASAVVTADGPGTAVTGTPAATAR